MDCAFAMDAFHQHGIAVLRKVFSDHQVAQLSQRAWAVRRWAEDHLVSGLRRVSVEGWPSDEPPATTGNTWGVNEITRRACFDSELINAICHGTLGESVAALVDQPRAWGLKLLWAPRDHPYRLHWHRDCGWRYDQLLPYKPPAQDHLQYNVALAPDDAFEVVPASHRRALTDHEYHLLSNNRRESLPGAVRIALNPGDVLIMDAHALHRGQASAAAPRMSLHYSVQAQWVPLLPWGEPDHFRWLCSEEFQQQLNAHCRQWYQRLSSATLCAQQLTWLEEIARQNGWDGQWSQRTLQWEKGARGARKEPVYPQ